jgi:hypothetical protein
VLHLCIGFIHCPGGGRALKPAKRVYVQRTHHQRVQSALSRSDEQKALNDEQSRMEPHQKMQKAVRRPHQPTFVEWRRATRDVSGCRGTARGVCHCAQFPGTPFSQTLHKFPNTMEFSSRYPTGHLDSMSRVSKFK